MDEIVIPCADLNEAVEFFTTRLGFRLEMIVPPEDPSAARISGHGTIITLKRAGSAADRRNDPADAPPAVHTPLAANKTDPVISLADEAKWITGRSGMEYRDLVPGKLGGRLSASLIRLASAGEVSDYVHYHKVRFQMIYCWHGRVRVVYEDQGDPFWLHPGDCVLQPPEIRHRVLESAANTLVVELTSPAIHETWTDHDIALPTGRLLADREFGGQRFVYHKAAESTPVFDEFGGFESHHFGIAGSTGGALRVFELRSRGDHSVYQADGSDERSTFLFLLTGRATAAFEQRAEQRITPGDSILVPPLTPYRLNAPANAEILCVSI